MPRPAGPTRIKPKRRFPPETLTDSEVRALLDACPATSASGIRNHALIAILHRTGLRISEALDLYPKDIDLDRGAIRVLNGKGGKSRVVGVDRGALAILARRLDVRACFGHGASRPVYCTASGERLTAGYVRRWLPVLGRRAGIAKRVHAHRLRHTHAAQLR
jgi:site-specific recombinase XerD